jgi:hypothetical protein
MSRVTFCSLVRYNIDGESPAQKPEKVSLMKIAFAITILLIAIAIGIGVQDTTDLTAGDKKTHSKLPLMSYFEEHAGGCGWYLSNGDSDDETKLGQFQTDCTGASTAFHPSSKMAVVWFNQGVDGTMQWLVNLDNHKSLRIPRPPNGELRRFAFNGAGNLLSFTINQNVRSAKEEAGKYLVFENTKYRIPTDSDGIFGLAHAFLWQGSKWKNLETKASPCCHEGAKEIYSLDAYQLITSNGALLLNQSLEQLLPYRESRTILDSFIIAKASSLLKNAPTYGRWRLIENHAWKKDLLVLALIKSPAPMTGQILIFENKEVGLLEGWNQNSKDLISIQDHSQFALISEAYTGLHPRIFDMGTGKLIFSSNSWKGTVFWPL